MTYVLKLADCHPDSVAMTGGKAVGLGRLVRHGLAVPEGVVLTTTAYRDCVPPSLRDHIARVAAGARSHAELQAASEEIRAQFTEDLLSDAVRGEIRAAYDALGGEGQPVAVRSSATAEDAADASFAGQQDTYLWIVGADQVVRHVVRCWGSLFTPQVIGYRNRMSVDVADLAMAVVVQRMVPAETAGVAMTLDPVTGDRATVYVEAAFGLGEGVVKGDTGSDSHWLDRAGERPPRIEIREKTRAHRFGGSGVSLVDVPEAEWLTPAITPEEAWHIARLAVQVEAAFGAPQDLEWALGPATGGPRELFFLQARPETVWSRRAGSDAVAEDWRADPGERNVLHGTADPDALWTVTNIQEAIPGVATPMTWSFFGSGTEYALREQYRSIGALSAAEAAPPEDMRDWLLGMFYGRAALRVDLLASWADRIPGMSGEALVEQFFSSVPGELRSAQTRRHYPRALLRSPLPFLAVPPLMRRNRDVVQRFWSESVAALPTADLPTALRLIEEGYDHFAHSLGLQVRLTQGAFSQVSRMLAAVAARQSAVGAHELVAGYGGHEEAELVKDMWDLSRERIDLTTFLARHGYHGWQEGELSNPTWRDDPSMVLDQVAAYRTRPESADPHLAEGERTRRREDLERRFLAALPRGHRARGRIVLALAATYLPMRGVSKAAFLQGLDVGRSAVRRVGELLTGYGALGQAGDAFYLTREELRDLPADARMLVAERRALRARYQRIEIPDAWHGMPEQIDLRRREAVDTVSGTAASPGVVEGPARVVLNPSEATLAEGEILVARDTDPAWASLMFLSSALVADIGGVMSHTAVVARELGIPCVVNTKLATRAISTGDRLRVDGAAGTVEVLERVASAVPDASDGR